MQILKLRQTLEMIKFSHTIFALPFALASMLVAAEGLPSLRTVTLLVLAMVAARSAGMSFNRFIDASLDAKNPRTASRHIPAGILSRRFVLLFSLMSGVLFVASCFLINRVCFLLSPLALGILILYSFTKRWTDWSHLVLGLALGISPPAAWIAVTGTLSLEPVLLGLAVLFWVAGFDVIYATQDYEFDQKEGLHSLVARFGIARALWISRVFHGLALAFLLLFGQGASLGWIYKLTVALIGILFLYEHSLVKPQDLSRVNAAFFNVNGYISLLFLSGVTLSL